MCSKSIQSIKEIKIKNFKGDQMKLKNTLLGLVILSSIFIAGCTDANKTYSTVKEESLGLRKTNLYTEDTTSGDKTMYGKSEPMSGYKIKRAFQDAPPMIPHSTEGLLPISINNNSCTGCHDPAVAESMGATAIPKSHFINFRPAHMYSLKEGFKKTADVMKNEVSIKEIPTLSGSRFSCTQCHAPQSTGKLALKNNFKAKFLHEDGNSKSRWHEVLTKDLDTIKK